MNAEQTFESVVKKGRTRSLMCAYNAINGEYCAENRMLLTEVLRDRWGFDGFVVTDWGAVKGRAKGAAFIRQMMGRSDGPSDSEQAEAMGEGSEKMMQRMMFEMPLGSLVSYGRMNAKQLKELIASLNR